MVRRFAVVGVVTPIAVTALAVVVQLVWLPQAPDPVATHWGLDGVDGSGPGWTYPALTALLGLPLPLWLWASGLRRIRAGSRGWSFRFLAAMSLGFAVFGAVLMTWAVRIQVGLESWHDVPPIAPGVVVAALMGTAAGIAGYLLQPKQDSQFEELPGVQVEVAPGERVAWLGVAKASRSAVVVLVISVLLLLVGAIVTWLSGDTTPMWILLGAALFVIVLGLTTMEADVRVSADGVEVRGPAGWPRSRVPISEIAAAQAVTVEALGSFGGWGWRRVPGATGVVLRSGPALRVERKQGRALVVAVDDAATAAALVNALVARGGA